MAIQKQPFNVPEWRKRLDLQSGAPVKVETLGPPIHVPTLDLKQPRFALQDLLPAKPTAQKPADPPELRVPPSQESKTDAQCHLKELNDARFAATELAEKLILEIERMKKDEFADITWLGQIFVKAVWWRNGYTPEKTRWEKNLEVLIKEIHEIDACKSLLKDYPQKKISDLLHERCQKCINSIALLLQDCAILLETAE